VVIGAGFSGHGFKFGPLVGETGHGARRRAPDPDSALRPRAFRGRCDRRLRRLSRRPRRQHPHRLPGRAGSRPRPTTS
jgi:hypothetical protein